MNDAEHVRDVLVSIAAEAAAIVDEVYRAPFDVEFKKPRDPVTAADRRANERIVARLEEAFPGVPVVAEESDPARYAEYRASERVFFVDPLDGTREFVKKNGEFVVMIGLLDGETPTVGVLHAPAQGSVWAGVVGRGAYHVDDRGNRRALHVSQCQELAAARIVSTRSHRSEALERALDALGAGHVDALGSAGLKCAEVGAGNAEAYVAPGRAGCRWDVCAGQAIIRAAGGHVTDAFGEPIDYRAPSLVNDQGIVASNGRLHDAILERLATQR